MKTITLPAYDRNGNQWVVTGSYIEHIGDDAGPLDDWMNWLVEKSELIIDNPMWIVVRCERQSTCTVKAGPIDLTS